MQNPTPPNWNKIRNVTPEGFEQTALEVFHFQYQHCAVYRQFCEAIHRDPTMVNSLATIPFLPISFFKTREITTTTFTPGLIFESSGTTGSINSRHLVKELSIYEESFIQHFEQHYGPVKGKTLLALLPSYLERSNSSLVYMMDHLIKRSGNPDSGFYLYDHKKLQQILQKTSASNPAVLLGVTYALLDFSEACPFPLQYTRVIETGGMKGRKKEMTREEVHHLLKKNWDIHMIEAEYGMTELLSQAYAPENGMFVNPNWMQVLVRASDDPFDVTMAGDLENVRTGGLNVIDLANLYSCAFIATDDVVRLHPSGRFEVLGRLDNSDIRGCGLMIL